MVSTESNSSQFHSRLTNNHPIFFIEDSIHVMRKVMLPIICLRNHNSKITLQVPCYVKFHVTLCSMLWFVIFHVKSYVTKHEFWGLLVLKTPITKLDIKWNMKCNMNESSFNPYYVTNLDMRKKNWVIVLYQAVVQTHANNF